MESRVLTFSTEQRIDRRRTKHIVARNSSKTKISHDLIFDIFKLLPVKSLVRFRCVDKFCSTIITHPSFIAVHRPLFRPKPRLLITFPAKLQSAQTFFTANVNGGGPASHCLTIPPRFSRYTTPSINGLVCMDFGLCATICNPSLRQHFTLPLVCEKSSKAASSTCYCVNSFGFDPVSNQYKVLNSWWNYSTGKTECRVFTLGTRSWRLLNDVPSFCPQRESICVNGIIFFRSKGVKIMAMSAGIIAFDVQFETFRVLQLPPGAQDSVTKSGLIQLGGRLAIVDHVIGNENQLSLWVLDDSWNEVWIQHSIIFPPSWKILKRTYFVVGTIATGEILVSPSCLSKPFYAFYLDINDFSWRRVEISGLPGYDSLDVSSNSVTVTSFEDNILPIA